MTGVLTCALPISIVKTVYGVERIPDPMLLKEMQAYRDGVNVDRLVAFCALVAFAKVQQSNRGLAKRLESNKENLVNSQKISKLNWGPFRHIGQSKLKRLSTVIRIYSANGYLYSANYRNLIL